MFPIDTTNQADLVEHSINNNKCHRRDCDQRQWLPRHGLGVTIENQETCLSFFLMFLSNIVPETNKDLFLSLGSFCSLAKRLVDHDVQCFPGGQ